MDVCVGPAVHHDERRVGDLRAERDIRSRAGGDNAAHAPSKDAPEADVFEQLTPAGPQPEQQLPVSSRVPREFIPEADALEQASPADRELFEDDE